MAPFEQQRKTDRRKSPHRSREKGCEGQHASSSSPIKFFYMWSFKSRPCEFFSIGLLQFCTSESSFTIRKTDGHACISAEVQKPTFQMVSTLGFFFEIVREQDYFVCSITICLKTRRKKHSVIKNCSDLCTI